MGEETVEHVFLLTPKEVDAAVEGLTSGEIEEAFDALDVLYRTQPDPISFDGYGYDHLIFMTWLTDLYGDPTSAEITNFETIENLSFRVLTPRDARDQAKSIDLLLGQFEAVPARLLPLIHDHLKSLHASSLATMPRAPAEGGSFMHQKLQETADVIERAAHEFAMTGEDVLRINEFARLGGISNGAASGTMQDFKDQHVPRSNLIDALVQSFGYLELLQSTYADASNANLGIVHMQLYG